MADSRPILLVEDNADDEALTLRAFSKQRISNEIVVARDGVEALEYLFPGGSSAAQRMPRLSLILLDLKLPRIDGLEVLRRIRSEAQMTSVPVVVLTTSREPQDIQQAYQLGANSYIRKPVDFEQFLQSVGLVATYWLSLNESV